LSSERSRHTAAFRETRTAAVYNANWRTEKH